MITANTAFDADVDTGASHRSTANTVAVRLATSFDDFMAATALMRIVSMTAAAPLCCDDIGGTLARLNASGGGPDGGGLLLATACGEVVGFALLAATDDGEIELAWMHCPENDAPDVASSLWIAALGMADEWAVPTLRISDFVPASLAPCVGQKLN